MTANEQRLALYLDAERKILDGQIVQMGDDQLSMPALFRVQDQIQLLRREVAAEKRRAAGGDSVKLASFC